jgi:death-on-curing protein
VAAWVWLSAKVLRAVHDEQLAEHGGAAGVRDDGLFESALARARNLAHDGQPDVASLAAAYGCRLARNHPFIDGSLRTAFAAVELFLHCNGYTLVAEDAFCVLTMLAVADGTLGEVGFAGWIRHYTQPLNA